jgi:hypothetical protein
VSGDHSTRHEIVLTLSVSALFMLVGYGLTFALGYFVMAEWRRLGSFAAVWQQYGDWVGAAVIPIGFALLGTLGMGAGIARFLAWKRAGFVESLPKRPPPEFLLRIVQRLFGLPPSRAESEPRTTDADFNRAEFFKRHNRLTVVRLIVALGLTIAAGMWLLLWGKR